MNHERVLAVSRVLNSLKRSERPADPTTKFEFRLEQALSSKDFSLWSRVFARVWNNFNLPTKQLYELVQSCPASFDGTSRDLRIELIECYRDDLLSGLTDKNIVGRVRKFTTLLQLANFVGRAPYLKERAFVITAFYEAKLPLPREIKERIAQCEKWNAAHGGRYNETELIGAGYGTRESDAHHKVFLHPLSHESITVYAKDALSPEERAKERVLRESAREGRRQARSVNPNKGASVSKTSTRKSGKN